MGIEPNRKDSGSVRFDRRDSSVRVRFDLILLTGSFGSVRFFFQSSKLSSGKAKVIIAEVLLRLLTRSVIRELSETRSI